MPDRSIDRPVLHPEPAPGPALSAFLRSLPALRSNPLQYIQQSLDDYGDFVHFRLAGLNAFLINRPESIQHVLQDNNSSYTKDTLQYNALSAITGEGLLTSDGDAWLAHRRLMQPAFSRQHMQGLSLPILAAVERVLNEWESYSSSGRPVDVDQAMLRLALEILGEALFGINLASEAPSLTEAVAVALDHIIRQVKSPPSIPAFIPTRANRRFRSAMRTLNRAVMEIITSHTQRQNSPPDDLLDMLIQAGPSAMGADQLRDEMVTLLIAGHETVASGLTWACYLLSQNPLAAEKMSQEIRQVLNGLPPTVADLPALDYTRRVFDEALRLYPPAWMITRKCVQEDQIAGVRIPAGSLVVIGVSAIHRNPSYWPDPDRFDPDRFTSEQSAGRPRYAYLPFGGGPRLCIGKHFALTEAPLILAAIYQRYRLELPKNIVVESVPLVTQRPRHGLPMYVIKNE